MGRESCQEDRPQMKHLLIVVGARPNLMKVAPLLPLLNECFRVTVIHTGQHYHPKLASEIRDELGIRCDVYLRCGRLSRGQQLGKMTALLSRWCEQNSPDIVVVVGDVTSTVAATLAAITNNVPVAHIEAGCRSGNIDMPEEQNRIVVDNLANDLFLLCEEDLENLSACRGNQDVVGNLMIDCLSKEEIVPTSQVPYVLCTLHRDELFRDEVFRGCAFDIVKAVSEKVEVIFPVHPHTQQILPKMKATIIDPVSYREFLSLLANSLCVITDSGGVQVEANYLGVPCLTMRETTEHKNTLKGTNRLVGIDKSVVLSMIGNFLAGNVPKRYLTIYDDGNAARRVTNILAERYAE